MKHKLALIAGSSPEFRTELSVLPLYSNTMPGVKGKTPGTRSSRFNHSEKGTFKVKGRIEKDKGKSGQLNTLKTSRF